ncbi:hypothetical protein ACFFV7_43375 [Nonomuraea spiralis]|uniref:Uncharacterized protein n=1 Tax=Nonomuraea spiralis TaxID=46182 RepID=A0ABV5IW23_9ACTN|nr:hypothetical protein [Nonomuraea spiralis]GGS91492.1 hypothetical protein GCM10010176_039150 [Nonomuraea spiralis]
MIRQPNDMAPSLNARRFGALVAVLNVITSGYFAVTSLVDPGALVPGGDQAAPKTYAAYMVVRSVVLLGGMAWLLALRAWRALALLLAFNGAVQIGDTAIGAAHHQVPQTIGPLVFAIALLTAAWLLAGRNPAPGRIRPTSQ